jgi:TPR repeat protein
MRTAKDLITATRQPQKPDALPVEAAVSSSLPQAQFEEGRGLLNKGRASHPCGVEFFRAAADAGHAVATGWLACCHWAGQGVEQSEAEGGRLARVALGERGLQSLADQGDASAQHALGSMHYIGIGVTRDACEAVAWWRMSAEQKYAEAQCDLGLAYREGEGVDKNKGKGAEWFQKAAEQGHVSAQYALAEAYWGGEGVDQNLDEAAGWARKSAEQGHVNAQFSLGQAYKGGVGVARSECTGSARPRSRAMRKRRASLTNGTLRWRM